LTLSKMSIMAESKSYGAIKVPEGNDEHYDEKNTYYLNSGQSTWGSFCRGAVPIVIALLIMGGFAYGMSHDFNHFYGPPRGTDDDSIKHDESWIPLDNGNDNSRGFASRSTASCAKNEKCHELELTGLCCPTTKGDLLECCI